IALRDDIRRQTQFRDAFIINDLTYNEEDIFFGVQIGAYVPQRNANEHAEEARTRYGLDVQVIRDEVRGLYKVQSTELLSWSDATDLRARILEDTPYDDTFLITRPSIDLQNFTYWLLIGSYNQRDYAESIARSLERITGYTYRVRYYSPNNMYQIVLQDIRSLDDAFKIRRELSEKYNIVDTIILQR
ncbi:MAG: SPOR domain-containing protein, partial [Balneolales bacterium]|nr:SPOR domain-containing protein [Balneolales bacterium]